jgi:hypothetical protein
LPLPLLPKREAGREFVPTTILFQNKASCSSLFNSKREAGREFVSYNDTISKESLLDSNIIIYSATPE